MMTPSPRISFLLASGWQQQNIPGLWRHPFKASGRELTTNQALQVENGPELHEDFIRRVAASLI